MKILLAASYFPYPLYSGGQVRLYNLLRDLGKKHQITLVCEARGKESVENLAEIKKYCAKIITVVRPRQWSIRNILKTGFSSFPFLLVGHENHQMKNVIHQELVSDHYDLLHVETFYVMHNLPDNINIPVVLVEHNVEWRIYKNWVSGFWFWPLRPLLYLDVLKMRFWEQHFWQQANKLIAVSDLDQKEMEKETQKTVEIISNGVDCAYFGEVKKNEPQDPTIVFVGSFKWMQNRDAALFLLKKLWPKIKKRVTNAKLWIIGNNALKYLKQKDEDLTVEEAVVDIRKVYSGSTLLLAPIRIGGGTKFKILESMASGLPIVTTRKGVEGLGPNTNGILVGETEEELVEKTVVLLQNREMRQNISRKEREFVRQNFDWEEISGKLEKVYENLH